VEELVEGPFKLIARVILGIVRAIIWLTWELMCERLLWYLGWPALKLMTLGKYPKERFSEVNITTTSVHFFVALVGFIYPLILAYYLSSYLGV